MHFWLFSATFCFMGVIYEEVLLQPSMAAQMGSSSCLIPALAIPCRTSATLAAQKQVVWLQPRQGSLRAWGRLETY